MSNLIDRQQALEIKFSNAIVRRCAVYVRMDELVNKLNALPTVPSEPRWIPIAERLPKDGTWNIFTDGKNISVERYKADAIDHFFPNGRWFELEDVIAWMPLPKPFEGGTK